MEGSGVRIDVGKVIGETFSIYGSNAVPLLGTALAVFVVAGIIIGLLAATGSLILVLLGAVVSLVALTLYTGFVVRLVQDIRDGRRDSTVGELISSAAPAIGGLIGNGILKAIAVAIGLLLLIVPGLILLTIWAVTAPAIVVERTGAIDAFGRSRELVKGNGWPVFAVILIAFLIVEVVSIALGSIAGDSDGARVVLSIIASTVTAPISALVSAVLFFDLGGGSGGAGAPPPPPASEAPPAY